MTTTFQSNWYGDTRKPHNICMFVRMDPSVALCHATGDSHHGHDSGNWFTSPSSLLQHLADHQLKGDKVDPAVEKALFAWLKQHNVDAFQFEDGQ